VSGLGRKVTRARSVIASKSFDAGADAGLLAGLEFTRTTLRKMAEFVRKRGSGLTAEEIEHIIETIKDFK